MKKIKFNLSSKNKNLILLAFLNLLILTVSIIYLYLYRTYYMAVIPVALLIMINFYFYTKLKSKKSKKEKISESEFVTLFTYFKVYILNGFPVYSAIKEISYFASDPLKEELNLLLKRIDDDKSAQPFVDFAHLFKPLIYEQLMISIYQMVEDGAKGTQFNQFELVFNKLADEVTKEERNNRERQISLLGSTPLLGAAILVILITLGVVAVIGDLIGGL